MSNVNVVATALWSALAFQVPLHDSKREALRIEANRRDVPYQSLIKIWLAERVEQAKN